MNDEDAGCLMSIIAIMCLVIGGIIGILLPDPQVLDATVATQGIPISNIALSEDGLTLTFTIGSDQWQTIMKEPVARPPNMSLATTLFVEGNQLLFLNSEGQRVFKDPLVYIDSLRLLEG